ncbi:MAG TPA: hypothetical protein VLG10_04290 [Methylomirabilota bacterium]|nr:hypothetical protein [Methylomirabilota bacterium]
MTVAKRAAAGLDPNVVIQALAALIPARVDLTHAHKILRVELFDDRVALSVLGPAEVFSVVKALACPGPSSG